MDIAFEGIYPISNVAVSIAAVPGSIVEGCSPELLEFLPSGGFPYTS
jgi:hypothetical protein